MNEKKNLKSLQYKNKGDMQDCDVLEESNL